jgi:hypothetical protein
VRVAAYLLLSWLSNTVVLAIVGWLMPKVDFATTGDLLPAG